MRIDSYPGKKCKYCGSEKDLFARIIKKTGNMCVRNCCYICNSKMVSQWNKRPLKEETKLKISKALTGRQQSRDVVLKRAISLRKTFSKTDSKNKLHERNIRRYANPEERLKTSISVKRSMSTPEYRAKRKELRAKQVINHQSSFEEKLATFLTSNNIQYKRQKYVKIKDAYNVDFFIQPNLVIEVDGNYWHNYPRGSEKDMHRTYQLLEQGYKVLRIWTNDIKYKFEETMNKILQEVACG